MYIASSPLPCQPSIYNYLAKLFTHFPLTSASTTQLTNKPLRSSQRLGALRPAGPSIPQPGGPRKLILRIARGRVTAQTSYSGPPAGVQRPAVRYSPAGLSPRGIVLISRSVRGEPVSQSVGGPAAHTRPPAFLHPPSEQPPPAPGTRIHPSPRARARKCARHPRDDPPSSPPKKEEREPGLTPFPAE